MFLLSKISQFFQRFLPNETQVNGLCTVGLGTLIGSFVFISLHHFGQWQPLELMIYDQMVRLRPKLPPDPRLLIIGITEEDIQRYSWPFSDELVAKILSKLSNSGAEVIGLDIFRDLPIGIGQEKLAKELKSPRVIVIQKLGDSLSNKEAEISAPKGVSVEQIGINDVVLDPDNVVRRNLMFSTTPSGKTFYSLSFQLAMKYLENQNLNPKNSPDNRDLILWGKAQFTPLEKNSGAYGNIDDKGYQILLNYHSGGQKVARIMSVQELLEGNFDSNWIQGKIVLIGVTARSLRDVFLTPYSGEQTIATMPGVLVHAHLVSQLVDAVLGTRPLFKFWTQWIEGIWISSWILIGVSLAWYRSPLLLAIGSPVLLLILSGTSFLLFLNGLWVPVATPILGFFVTTATVVAYRAQQSQRQEKIVMRLLGQHISPEVANTLWKQRDHLISDGRLPGQKLTATLFFTDIRNFSTISELISPESLMMWLNEYLEAMIQVICNHHGIINKFMGDGIMAAFGVPVPRTTDEEIAADAKAAVACALAITDRLRELNSDWKNRGLPVIQMRIGIFTGQIVAGSLGGKERLEYGLLGDTVNTASRLESCEKERQPGICRILIADQTLQYIQNDFVVEPWGVIPLKGKQQIVNVYRVISYKIGQ